MDCLVFDSTPLSTFARADRLSDLENLTNGYRRVSPSAVLDEIRRGVHLFPQLKPICDLVWLEEVRVESREQLLVFADCLRYLGKNGRNAGEAEAIAWASAHAGSIVFLDDQAAVQYAKTHNIEVRRTLAIIAGSLRLQRLALSHAVELVDDLITKGGARFPCTAANFEAWSRENGFI